MLECLRKVFTGSQSSSSKVMTKKVDNFDQTLYLLVSI